MSDAAAALSIPAATTTPAQRTVWQYLWILLVQVVYVSPILWFFVLLGNHVGYLTSGHYAWTYPTSPYGWFSFASLPLWSGAVLVMWSLYYFVFAPRRTPFWLRCLIAGSICWAGEYAAGFIADNVFHSPLQIWREGNLKYITWGVLPWWWFAVVQYHVLTVKFADLTPDYTDA